MFKIYKYAIPIEDNFDLELPVGSKILHIASQRDEGFLWALVDPNVHSVKRHFRLAGTGHSINEHLYMNYIGTFQMMNGDLIWHLFELV